jgi:ComF family protein
MRPEYFQRDKELSTKMMMSGRRVFSAGKLLEWTAAAFWPSSCVLCGASGEEPFSDLCSACAADLPLNATCCSRCAEPLLMEAAREFVCGACIRRTPRFDRAVCAFTYAYPVDQLVRALKYRNAVSYARVLGDLLAARLLCEPRLLPQIIIPVPLAHARFRERGYNQAIEVARRLEKRLSIPMHTGAVVRTRETAEQAGLDQKQRRKNIRGAFELVEKLSAKTIAVVDDVMTTGSTANELARVLKRGGARRIEIWAVARAAK